MVKTAVTNNIAYQMQVIQNKKNYFILPPGLRNVPTRFSNNPIEEYDTVENTVSATVKPELESIPEPEHIVNAKRSSFKCFYCDDILSSNYERRNHKQQYHPDKPLDYPTEEDFNNRLER